MTIAAIALATLVSTSCPSFSDIEEVLTDQVGERPVIASVSHQGTAFMFWTNESTGTWTITETVGECTYVREYGIGLVVPSYGEPV